MADVSTNRKYFRKIVCWTARFTSLLSVVVLLLFFIGESFNPAKLTAKEWTLFFFFPIGVMVGLLVGWKKELIGGLISVLSLVLFCLIESTNGGFPGLAFFVFASPGFLFLASHFIT